MNVSSPDGLISAVRIAKSKAKKGDDIIVETSVDMIKQFCGEEYDNFFFNLMDAVVVQEGRVEEYEAILEKTTEQHFFGGKR